MRGTGKNAPDPAAVLRAASFPLTEDHDYDRILAFVGDAPLVLLGEATHGTHDFYAARARITRGLIEHHGFSAVAIEGDWPDAYRVNRFVQRGEGATAAAEALVGFARFPTWMWRNTDVESFVGWLHQHNKTKSPEGRAGFFGLDLYSLHASMRAVVDYLERHDPTAAQAARASYGCFEEFGHDTDTYAWAVARLGDGTCEEAVTRELVALRERRAELLRRDGMRASDEFFSAERNARLARNAEEYYRTMFRGRVASWNVRDEHMAETLQALLVHLEQRGQPPKIVVWAHNSHLGDARATEMGESGEWNLGQLTRERIAANARLIGFTTYAGTVIAASDWGANPERKRVRPARPGSIEDLLHQTETPRFFLPVEKGTPVHSLLAEPRLERAIGVIYRPESERISHYFHARVSDQFDAVIHFDESQAVDPLPGIEVVSEEEVPETYPSGI
jgi:erythromycin esterase-like protein